MTNIIREYLIVAILSLSLFLVLPQNVMASTTITISNNESGSQNTITTNNTNIVTIIQSNFSSIFNNVFSNANTGHNKIKGKGTIKTGNATSNVVVNNTGNSNVIAVPEFNTMQGIFLGFLSLITFAILKKRFA